MISIKPEDWQHYLEREDSIFYVSVFNCAYGELLKKFTGFGFTQQLYHYDHNKIIFYKFKDELTQANHYYLELIKQKDPRILVWYAEGKKALRKKEEMIASANQQDYIYNYDHIMEQYAFIFLYATTIPFRILSAVDYALSRGEKQECYQDVIDLFQPFRKQSLSVLQDLTFKQIWCAAAGHVNHHNLTDFSLMTAHELGCLFNNTTFPNLNDLENRKSGCIFYTASQSKQFFFEYNHDIIRQFNSSRAIGFAITELNGTVISNGFVSGRAKIVNSPKDLSKCEKGDIIVSINSTPSLMPALLKCKAIVTDEGGITCHAAIISRELNIPCIVGTKHATKIFKDGDEIIVDANLGNVRKILKK